MNERPILNKKLDSITFRSFYYLKEELMNFCKQNGLPTYGGKIEIADRIAYYLDTGEILNLQSPKKKFTANLYISKNSIIESDFVFSEKNREFFKIYIGKTFSFNVAFQKWLKLNAGKSYNDAIAAYYQLIQDKRKEKTVIDKQFEYNTYIRDFFSDNKGKSLKDAIVCWKYKKQTQGHNRYEKSDLEALR